MQARSETLCDFWADLRALCQRSGLEPGRARRHRGVDVAPSSKKSASGLRAGQISSRKRNVVPRRFPSGDSRVETIGSHFQLSKISVADLVPELAQFVRKAAQALARPAQRRHRIAARIGLDQRVQGVEKTGIRFTQRFAAPARPAYAIKRRRRRRFQFLQPPSNRAGGHPRHPRHRGYAAISRRTSFRRNEKPALTFIQLRRYRRMARLELAKRLFINHPTTLRRNVYNANPATPLRSNPIRLLADRP